MDYIDVLKKAGDIAGNGDGEGMPFGGRLAGRRTYGDVLVLWRAE